MTELFRKATDCGVFKKRSTLYNLLFDTTSNLLCVHKNGGHGRKKTNNLSTMKFGVVLNFGGTFTHNFLSFNFLGLVMNTSQKIHKSEGFCIQLG